MFFLVLFGVGVVALRLSQGNEPSLHAPSSVTESPGEIAKQEPIEAPLPLAKKTPNLRSRYCANAYNTTCSAPWPSIDPTGKVNPDVKGEIRALRLMRNLIRENPSWTSEQVQERLAEEIYTEDRRKGAEDAFKWVISSVQTFITDQEPGVFSPEEKARLLDRISQIHLELPPPASTYSDAADLITKNTAYYERTSKNLLRLRIGGAYLLNTTSWFNIVYTLSHEVAHSFDPCEAAHASILPKAYQELVSCFVSVGWVEKSRASCGPNEQISEVFADWVASQLLGHAISEFGKNYSATDRTNAAINAAHDLCDEPTGDTLNLLTHQDPEVRIGSVVGKSPTVLQALGCPSTSYQYCHFKTAWPSDFPQEQSK